MSTNWGCRAHLGLPLRKFVTLCRVMNHITDFPSYRPTPKGPVRACVLSAVEIWVYTKRQLREQFTYFAQSHDFNYHVCR